MRRTEEMLGKLHGEQEKTASIPGHGLARWLLARLRRENSLQPRLALLERITLAPRQTVALVEAEGRRLLVATSPDAAPTFYALDEIGQLPHRANTSRSQRRVSW